MTKDNQENIEYYLLAGDIGGTNCRLALYNTKTNNNTNKNEAVHEGNYKNKQYLSVTSFSLETNIINLFLEEALEKIHRIHSTTDTTSTGTNNVPVVKVIACFAVAGPVSNNIATLTNVAVEGSKEPQKIIFDGNLISSPATKYENNNKYLGLSHICSCTVVNDFLGQGYGLLDLDLQSTKDVIELIPGSYQRINPLGPKACIGAGTGLGKCFLTIDPYHTTNSTTTTTNDNHNNNNHYICFPSEGGHVDYTPRNKLQIELSQYLQQKFNQSHRISAERVASGTGISNIYEFLSQVKYPHLVSPHIAQLMQEPNVDIGKIIGMNANASSSSSSCDQLCVETLNIFAEAYGAETANTAVTFLPTGGLFVSGGVTPLNLKFIQGDDSPFMKAYRDKGRLSDLVMTFPLFVIMANDVGLRGAKLLAMREYNRIQNSVVK